MLTMIDDVINTVSGAVYNPWVPLLLVIAGILLTIRTKFPQFRMLPESIRVVMEKPANEEGMSSFGALMISTASRVGTGNIVGVSPHKRKRRRVLDVVHRHLRRRFRLCGVYSGTDLQAQEP